MTLLLKKMRSNILSKAHPTSKSLNHPYWRNTLQTQGAESFGGTIRQEGTSQIALTSAISAWEILRTTFTVKAKGS